MAKLISPMPRLRFDGSDGLPLVSGKLYTYAAGTSTPVTTYTDSVGGTPNANPVILDAYGEASVWLDSVAYKFVLKTSADVTVWTIDNLGTPAAVTQYESIVVVCSDETTALAAGTAKVTFIMPYTMTVTGVVGSLTTAQSSGNIFTVDVNESGATILSTKLTIDNTEKNSTTAATPAVVSDTTLTQYNEITVDIDQIGNGTAKGLKVILNGYRSA